MDLRRLLLSTASEGIDLQSNDGSMPAGHNGPWNDQQTPVRNTAHWAVIFAYAYDLTNHQQYLEACKRCIRYLHSEDARPSGETFIHRRESKKDNCNGIVGQAWCIESLSMVDEIINEVECKGLAKHVFLKHPFDHSRGLWKTVETDGTVFDIHGTVNQQIMFAASGSELASESREISEMVSRFLNELDSNLDTYPSGLIRHTGCQHRGIKRRIWRVINEDKKNVAKGYHSFNLYALGVLKENFPNHRFWDSETIKRIIEYTQSIDYKHDLLDSVFSFVYNPTSFEIMYFFTLIDGCEFNPEYWMEEQDYRSVGNNQLMSCTSDRETLLARTYQVIRII